MSNKYTVPIIPYNLGKQETIIQIAEVLNHLSNVTEDLLKRIENRLDSSNNKLLDISGRIAKVNVKVTKLTGAKHATKVFSSCKYPAGDLNKQYITIFDDIKTIELIRHKVKYKKVITNDEPLDKLNIYHVKLKNMNNKKVNGLGEIPNEIDCVNDLLLYNSGKNLYKNFVMSDALDVIKYVKEQEISNGLSIGAAPYSISERSTIPKSTTQTYFYSPDLGEVPALDVPLDLPDLPGIADNLRYDSELGPGIAPSIVATPSIPELPIINNCDENKAVVNETIEPPSPPIIEFETKPPSPPPPPPPPISKVEEPQNEFTSTTKSDLRQLNDVHANLMEAIRKAGGTRNAKLKSTELSDIKSTEVLGSGSDLMADLHAKLSLRRKGISGTKKQNNFNNLGVGSAMEKISAMIPPPSTNNNDPNDIEDEDWD